MLINFINTIYCIFEIYRFYKTPTSISIRFKLFTSGGVESPIEVTMFCFSKTSSLIAYCGLTIIINLKYTFIPLYSYFKSANRKNK